MKHISERVYIEINEPQVKKEVDQNTAEVKTMLKWMPIKKTSVLVVVPVSKNTVVKKKRVFDNRK